MAGFEAPVRAPSGLELVTTLGVRFNEKFGSYLSKPAYSDFEKFTETLDPTGDLIDVIYAHPGVGMEEWKAARHMQEVDFKYFQIAVRKFATGFPIDLDDVKDDANPIKRQMYVRSAQGIAYSAALIWPDLVGQAITAGLTKTWLPDGQPIWDVHNFNPDDSTVGTYRNYYSKTVQGGSAATPLTYANLLAMLRQGLTFLMPNGKPYPISYGGLVVGPADYEKALRLCTSDKLPVGEIYGQTLSGSSAGGEAENEIARYFKPKVFQLAGMPANNWMVCSLDEGERIIGVKKRQPITIQFTGVGFGPDSLPTDDADEGLISEQAFDTNKAKWGVKARGEATFVNWWGGILCDGTP